MLRRGGVLAIDNVLWKGKVVEAAQHGALLANRTETRKENESEGNRQVTRIDPKPGRPDIATLLHNFNVKLARDPRVSVIALPIGDGLTLARKR